MTVYRTRWFDACLVLAVTHPGTLDELRVLRHEMTFKEEGADADLLVFRISPKISTGYMSFTTNYVPGKAVFHHEL